MDQEKATPHGPFSVVGVAALSSLQGFDDVGMMAGLHPDCSKPAPFVFPKVLLCSNWRRKFKG